LRQEREHKSKKLELCLASTDKGRGGVHCHEK
jgi:hypothetical protein